MLNAANIYAHLDYTSKLSSAQAMVDGLLLPESNDFSSKWLETSVTEEKSTSENTD